MTVRRGWRVLVVAALAMAMVGAVSDQARAGEFYGHNYVEDDFEASPAPDGRWTQTVSGTGGGFFVSNPANAHSGSVYAYRWAQTGFSSISRTVDLARIRSNVDQRCYARAWLRAVGIPAAVNLEVIDPATWTYIGLEHATLQPGAGWQQVWTRTHWRTSRADVLVRISLLGNGSEGGLRIDDTLVHC